MASIQGIYLALFGRPADPAGLAYWTEQSKNGADLSKIIDTMTKLPEATARFNGLTDAALVTVVYQALFDRLPDATGLAFFTEQLKSGKQSIGSIAINILDGASGNDLTLIQNREKAANVFTASIDTPAEIAAYNGTNAANFARDFIKTVSTDPNSVPSATQVQSSISAGLPSATGGQTPTDGQTPTTGGGGGGGGTTPAPAVASLDSTKTLVLAANADATVTLSGSTLIISANGFSSSVINAADVEKITLSSGAKLHTLGTGPLNGATNLKEISGAGTLDVQGVLFKNADGSLADAKARFEPSPSLDDLYGKVAAGTGFTVNGNEADTIKGIWDVLDDRYGVAGYNNDKINTDFINLGLRYVDFLAKNGTPFTDLVAKADASGRSQSMHDNLLGNLNKATVESRFIGTEKDAFLARIPDDYQNRPVYDGNKGSVDGKEHDTVRFFDYNKGWARPDYGKFVINGSDNNDVFTGKSISNAKLVFIGLKGNDTFKGGSGNDLVWGDGPNVTEALAANYGDDTINGGLGTNVIALGSKSQDIQLGGQDTVTSVRGQQGDDVIFNFNFGPTNRYDDIASGGTTGNTTGPRSGTQDDLTFDILKLSGYSNLQDFLANVTVKIGNDNAAYTSKVATVLGTTPTINGNIITTANGDIYTGPASGGEFEIVLEFANNGGSVTFANAMSRWEKFGLLKQLGLLPNATSPSNGGVDEDAALNNLIYANGSTADPTSGLVTLTDAQETALIGILQSQGNLVLA